MSDITTKCCTACKQTKPIVEFSRRKANRDGLRSQCKACDAQYRHEHKEERLQYNRYFAEVHPDYYKNYRLAHLDTIREQQNRGQKKYQLNHRGKIIAHRQSHRQQATNRMATWRQNNPERNKAITAKYQASHPEILRINKQRRKARKRMLPDTFRISDWRFSLDYWHGTCAYCGHGPSLFDRYAVLHSDHFVPLNSPDCPGTIPTNILPACQACNQSKNDTNPTEWLIEKLGSRRAKKKLTDIQAYFDVIKSREEAS